MYKCKIVAIIYVNNLKLAVDLRKEIMLLLNLKPFHDYVLQCEDVYVLKEKEKHE